MALQRRRTYSEAEVERIIRSSEIRPSTPVCRPKNARQLGHDWPVSAVTAEFWSIKLKTRPTRRLRARWTLWQRHACGLSVIRRIVESIEPTGNAA